MIKPDTTKLDSMLNPLIPYFTDSGLDLGANGSCYEPLVVKLEGLARLLWGLVPQYKCGIRSPMWDLIIPRIINGVNPDHAEYWGMPTRDKDHRFVEMAPIAYMIIVLDTELYSEFKDTERQNLCIWLYSINSFEVCANNWLWFRVLVNLALSK